MLLNSKCIVCSTFHFIEKRVETSVDFFSTCVLPLHRFRLLLHHHIVLGLLLNLCGRRRLPPGAGQGTVDEAPPRQEGPAQQGGGAGAAREAGRVGVPVLPVVGHLAWK